LEVEWMRKNRLLGLSLAACLALTVCLAAAAPASGSPFSKILSTISRSIRNRLPPPHEVEGGILFQYEAPAARMVTLAGSFNNWAGTKGGGRYDATIDPMTDNGQGVWSIVKPLPPGRYQYKFVIDNGVRWETDPSNPNTGQEEGITNSLIIVPQDVGYAYEIVTGTVTPGQTEIPVTPPPATTEEGTTFQVNLPDAKEVFVAGQFNDWSPARDRMTKDKDGVWRATLDLKPGTYEYRFVADGQWIEDPGNPDKVPNPYGGSNSVVTVK
jgi:1,4-alpha-glucan branching enzyme